MITVEIVAAYLPYNLQIRTSIDLVATLGAESGLDIIGINSVLKKRLKPILRPLSDYEPTFNKYHKPYWSDFDYFCQCVYNGSLEYSEVIKLISDHYNVFNLPEGEYVRK